MKRAAALLLLLLALTIAPAQAYAPYTTYTLGPGNRLYPSQDAYIPLAQIDLPIAGADDLFLGPDGFLYIADTGNGRILKLDADFQVVAELGAEVLDAPTGVFVTGDGRIFAADSRSNTVVILAPDGALINQFGRPVEPLFGASRPFRPRKLIVDARQNIYVVGEGAIDGLAMLNTDGGFIGYFGANSAEMSLRMILQRLFLTEEQLSQFIRNEAASPSNVAIDDQSLIYTITAGTAPERSIRRFTVSGRNLIERVVGSNSFRDLDVSADGLLVAVDADGRIFEYAVDGTLLFMFGARDSADQRLGLLSNPSGIERAGDRLYVLDRDRNAIIIYQVTEFARRLHEGVRLYLNGLYRDARPLFEDALTHNGLVIMAYQALADADFNRDDYASALRYYRLAEDRAGYSEAFWELRNTVLQQHLGGALGVFVVGWVALSVFNRLERRRGWLDPLRRLIAQARRLRLVDDFVFLFRFIRQPADSFYSIKTNERGSLLFALLLYAWVTLVRIAALYITGFPFNPFASAREIQLEAEILYTLGAFVVWNSGHYLIATISDGEGSLRQVIIGTAYSLFPYALFALPIALISNVLTLNEVFLYTFSSQLILFWCGVMLVIMVKEIHNYTISETVRNLLLSLFTMAVMLLTAYILYVLFTQLFEFVLGIIREVGLRG
ncbi:MAG: YIP1 family protein [Candidatus Flexifilum sp.]